MKICSKGLPSQRLSVDFVESERASRRFRVFCLTLACVLTLLAAPATTYAGCGRGGGTTGASGARGAPEDTPAQKARQHALSYNLGKRIMEGKIQLRSRVPELVSPHLKVLKRHEGRPASDDINQVLGRLSKDQLAAVKVYLDTKYPSSPVSAEELRQARFLEAKESLFK